MDTVVRWQAVTSTPIGETLPSPTADASANHHAHLPLLKPGIELESGGVYLDLANPTRGPFRALSGQVAGSGNRYVAQRDVTCEVWCHLIKSAAASAFGGLPEVDCSELKGISGLFPWPAAPSVEPAEVTAP